MNFRVDPARLERFAVAYLPSVMEAAREIDAWRGGMSEDDYAVATTVTMVEAVQRGGVETIAAYYLNTRGGAIRRTCQALGIEASTIALAEFIGGRG